MTGIKPTLIPPKNTPGEIKSNIPETESLAIATCCKVENNRRSPRMNERNPATSAKAPISFTQRGAFQAAKKTATNRIVRKDIKKSLPSINNLNISQKSFAVYYVSKSRIMQISIQAENPTNVIFEKRMLSLFMKHSNDCMANL